MKIVFITTKGNEHIVVTENKEYFPSIVSHLSKAEHYTLLRVSDSVLLRVGTIEEVFIREEKVDQNA